MRGGERRPAARASAARDMLAGVDVLRPGTRDAVRARMPRASLEALDDTPGVSWLDYEHDRWVMEGTLAVLGREDAVRAWHGAMSSMLERPMLRNFMEAALRLFLGRPGQLLALVPKGWPLAYRDFCTPSFHRTGPGEGELRFEDVAPQAFETEGYLHCWHAVCLGVFDLEKPRHGRVEFDVQPALQRAVARFTWQA